jgi:methyltransferase-like protein 6
MKTGAVLCFRDYAIYDEAQVRFAKSGNHKLDENLYVRQDGTMSFFFSIEYLCSLFESQGFKTLDAKYVQHETVNHAKDLVFDRCFVQAKFQKLFLENKK